eukprot:scaffold356752_cov17-Prasinocladus_malaysianus.AAC.1
MKGVATAMATVKAKTSLMSNPNPPPPGSLRSNNHVGLLFASSWYIEAPRSIGMENDCRCRTTDIFAAR